MLIAGAGGHALELLDMLINQQQVSNLVFFDNVNPITLFEGTYPVLKTEDDIKNQFQRDPHFILGTGNPKHRKFFYDWFIKLGGVHYPVKGEGVVYSNFTENNDADIFNLCFIGAKTKIGKCALINTGAQLHHEVQIGEFSEINPGAVVLGKVQIGNFTSIGANATILPKVKIGNNAVVGAGSVVTKDIQDGVTVIGVPAKSII